MKKGMMRAALLLLLSALLVLGAVLGTSAKTAEGATMSDYSYYAGTQTNNGVMEKAEGWQTAQVGHVNLCPRDVKLWEEGNGLWIDFDYYYDQNSTTSCGLRLRCDKQGDIIIIKSGVVSLNKTYFPSYAQNTAVAGFSDYGWQRITVQIDQDTRINDEGTDIEHSWRALLWINGERVGAFEADPKYLTNDHCWKLYDAAISPDGASIDYERASASPGNAYTRFYFYGSNMFNQDEENRQMRAQVKLRNIRTYYGDMTDIPTVAPIHYELDGGSLPTERVEAISNVSNKSYVATSYHPYYDIITSNAYYAVGMGLGTLPTPTKLGYVFTGWYSSATEQSDATRVQRISASATDAVTLYAGWRQVATVLSYELDGGAFGETEPPREILYGASGVTPPAPTKKYHAFRGWLIDGATEPVMGTLAIAGASDRATVTLTAVWELVFAFVEYDTDGGVLASDSPDSVSVSESAIIVPDPSRAHYEFLGWSIDGSEPIKGSVPCGAVTAGETVTLKAIWRRAVGSITFVAPTAVSLGGDYTTTYSLTEPTSIVFPTVGNAPALTFGGWYLNASCAGAALTSFTVTEDLLRDGVYDLVFYGKFERTLVDEEFFGEGSSYKIAYVNPNNYEIGHEIKDGALHLWKPKEVATDYDILTCSLNGNIPVSSRSFTFEFAIKGTYTSGGAGMFRFRRSVSGLETNLLSFSQTGEIMLGGRVLGQISSDAYLQLSFVITFEMGQLMVDAYVNGELKYSQVSVSSQLGYVGDPYDDTHDIGRFEFGLLGRSQYDLYFDYLTFAEGTRLKHVALSDKEIPYELNGGTIPAGYETHTFGVATVLPIPTKPGCIFKGWYFEPSFHDYALVTEIPADATDVFPVYARWEEGFVADLSGETALGGFAEWNDAVNNPAVKDFLVTMQNGALLIEKSAAGSAGSIVANGLSLSGDTATLEMTLAAPENAERSLGFSLRLLFGDLDLQLASALGTNGRLRFKQEDGKYFDIAMPSEAAVHVAFALNFAKGEVDIFVDGEVVLSAARVKGLERYTLADLDGFKLSFQSNFTGSLLLRDVAMLTGALPSFSNPNTDDEPLPIS